NPSSDANIQIAFTNYIPAATATVYQVSAANVKAVLREPDLTNATASLTFVVPAYSTTMLRFTALDSDSDGIPDWWMQMMFGHATGQAGDSSRANDDADGDGLTTLQEYQAGTSPTSASSAMQVTVAGATNAGFHVSFPTVNF